MSPAAILRLNLFYSLSVDVFGLLDSLLREHSVEPAATPCTVRHIGTLRSDLDLAYFKASSAVSLLRHLR